MSDNELQEAIDLAEIYEKENVRLWGALAKADKIIHILEKRALLSSGDLEIVVMLAEYHKENPVVKHDSNTH